MKVGSTVERVITLGLMELLRKSLGTLIDHRLHELHLNSSTFFTKSVIRAADKVSKFTFCSKSRCKPSRWCFQVNSAHFGVHLLTCADFTIKERSSSISHLFSPCHLSSDKTCAVCSTTTSHVLTTRDSSAAKVTRNSPQLTSEILPPYAQTGQLKCI